GDASEQPEVTVLVDPCAVADEVSVLPAAPVSLQVSVGVAVDAAQHRRPRVADDEVAATTRRYLLALLVVDGRVDGGKGLGRRAGLQRRDAGQRSDEDHPGFGLPPRVDHRRPVAADVFAVPDPRLWVDGLADRAQKAERAQV